jgi:hypothetical protein
VVFELVEMNSEVISLAQVDPKIFSSAPAALTSSASSAPNTSPDSSTNASPFALGPLPAAASADLEVEVLRLIHQTGADMGEQIDVKRAPDGSLKVSGIVETDQRKTEILAGLQPIAGNPAVRIEIQTVAEAVAQHKDSKRNVITEGVEIQRLGIAAEPQLRVYFERRGGNVDAAVRQFAAGAVSQSGRAMQHLGALRRLVNQFSTAQLRDLTPEARANWLGLLRTHARAYQQQTAALRRDLKPIFFAGAGDELPGSPAIRNDEELRQVALDLFATAAANDQVVRSAFTVNSEGARFTAVSTPQFWQAMKKAEALAAAIGRQ